MEPRRQRTLRRFGLAARTGASIALPLLAALAGCETRAAEPAPAVKEARSGGEGARSEPRRPACVKETPETPVRSVIGAIPDPDCPEDPGPRPVLSTAEVAFPDAPLAPPIKAELATRDKDRQRGLMYRQSMGANEGMLFVFEEERKLTFWMHNTCLPLDMVFINKDGVIVGIEENTPTLSDQTFGPDCPASYVLETNAGWTRKNGLRAGMKVTLPPAG